MNKCCRKKFFSNRCWTFRGNCLIYDVLSRFFWTKFGKISENTNQLVLRSVSNFFIHAMCFHITLKHVKSKKKNFSMKLSFLNPIFRKFGINLQLFHKILHSFFFFSLFGTSRSFLTAYMGSRMNINASKLFKIFSHCFFDGWWCFFIKNFPQNS